MQGQSARRTAALLLQAQLSKMSVQVLLLRRRSSSLTAPPAPSPSASPAPQPLLAPVLPPTAVISLSPLRNASPRSDRRLWEAGFLLEQRATSLEEQLALAVMPTPSDVAMVASGSGRMTGAGCLLLGDGKVDLWVGRS